jgi:hypothetical protein
MPPSRRPSGWANEEEEEAAIYAPEFPTISDYSNGNQYSSDQGVNKNENYSPASIYMGQSSTRTVWDSSLSRIMIKVT